MGSNKRNAVTAKIRIELEEDNGKRICYLGGISGSKRKINEAEKKIGKLITELYEELGE